ncbi:helix-loop-helix DNA-binding domain-containing protein [Hyaloscypha finlandica]|nr:helix-loop-helix DNA-binding domain-containing protein [Hyaloscypha finlandica]
MDSQLFDQFLEDSWSAESCGPEPVNTTSDVWPNYAWLNDNPLACKYEGFQSFDDLESSFNLSSSSSPPLFELPSPISDSSSLSEANLFNQKSLIDLLVRPTAIRNNTIALTAPCNSPSGENFPAIATPNLASSPGSSEANSPWDVEHEAGVKRSTTRTQKRRSENSRAKVPCSKHKNSHNLIEKKYRNNLNSKIQTLRDSIPSLRSARREDEDEDGMDSDAAGSRTVQKCNKGTILEKAIEYIAQLEKEIESLSKENSGLQLMVKGYTPHYLALGARY